MYFYTNDFGIRKDWIDNADGSVTIRRTQDAEAILEQNKAMANHNDGYTPSRDMRRVASIPMVLILKWLEEEGWDAFDPACAHKLAQKLNSNEYMHLRTAPGRVAALQDGGLR